PLPGWTTAALASGTVRPFLIPPRDQGGRAHSLSGVRVQAEGTPGKVIQGRDVTATSPGAQRPAAGDRASTPWERLQRLGGPVTQRPVPQRSARRPPPPTRPPVPHVHAPGPVALQESWSQ